MMTTFNGSHVCVGGCGEEKLNVKIVWYFVRPWYSFSMSKYIVLIDVLKNILTIVLNLEKIYNIYESLGIIMNILWSNQQR